MTVGSLFAGIGGFDLGFERAGFTIRWQVEIDPWARRVLEKHWPHVYRHDDIRTAGAHNLEAVDVLVGGFPCQDISPAGKKTDGIKGTRSSLWGEYARIIRTLRPRYVVVENSSDILSRGLGIVLGDLAACGYDAEWDCIPAAAVGAPHRRDRLWLIAACDGLRHGRILQLPIDAGAMSHADRWRCEVVGKSQPRGVKGTRGCEPDGLCEVRQLNDLTGRYEAWWLFEPPVGRVVDGLPGRVDRLRGLGNAIVPQIAEWIAGRILDAEARQVTA